MEFAVTVTGKGTGQSALVPAGGSAIRPWAIHLKVLFPLSVLVVFLTLFLAVGHVCAHCTEGRVRVTLDWSHPSFDDFAYFIEPYVNQEKYKGQHQPYRGRFYVMDFDRVEIKNRQAEVFFEVLDMRNNHRFEDSMRFVRSPDGVWRYEDGDGAAREVFSYIPEWLHFLDRFGRPAAMIGVPLLAVVLVLLRLRKSRARQRSNLSEPGQA